MILVGLLLPKVCPAYEYAYFAHVQRHFSLDTVSMIVVRYSWHQGLDFFLQGKSLVDKWEEEFTSEKDITDEDFWERLQKHWEDVDQ